MIKGLAITPPILGRISIGKTIEKEGKRLPQKDDQFTITTQMQGKQGWIKHPVDEQLRASNKAANKLRQIPVKLLFGEPELNLRAEYSLFDRQTGRPICVGNGVVCNRRTGNGIEQHPCPSPDACPIGKHKLCKPFGRLYVSIAADEHTPTDELGAFIFRTTGFNSIRTLMARLHYYQAISGNLLAYLPLQLTLRGKSTTQSYRQPVYFVDLTLKDDMTLSDAITQAKALKAAYEDSGMQQQALDSAAKAGFAQSCFEINSDEGLEVIDEFYAASQTAEDNALPSSVNPAAELQQQLTQTVQTVS